VDFCLGQAYIHRFTGASRVKLTPIWSDRFGRGDRCCSRHIGRGARPAAFAAQWPLLGQSLRHDLGVAEQLIGVFHPRFGKIFHLFGDIFAPESN